MDIEEIESENIDPGGHPVTVCFDTLIEYVAERLAYSVRKTRLQMELSCILYGEIEDQPGVPVKRIAARSYERLVGKARALLKERSLICAVESKEESIGFYENLLADDDVPPAVRIKARENMDRIKQSITSSGMGGHDNREQVIDLDKIDIVLRKKILEDIRGNTDVTNYD